MAVLLMEAFGQLCQLCTARRNFLAHDVRRRAPFIPLSKPAFALPRQLLPGETWHGASAIAPTSVHTLTELFSWKLLDVLSHSSA